MKLHRHPKWPSTYITPDNRFLVFNEEDNRDSRRRWFVSDREIGDHIDLSGFPTKWEAVEALKKYLENQ